ncbi:hypothetical protein TNCV_4582881 [Trichonephila clavipes]|nr:hypothetical protein TNCV_4582881 [Trichonephila clavipes]
MKTSSVEFISPLTYPFTYEIDGLCFENLPALAGSEGKREIVLNRRSTEENIDAFSSGLHGKPQTAYGQNGCCGMQAQLMRTETVETVELVKHWPRQLSAHYWRCLFVSSSPDTIKDPSCRGVGAG